MYLQNVMTTGGKKETIKRHTDIRSSHKDNKQSCMCVLASVELSFHWKEIENDRHRRLELHDGKAQHHLYHNLSVRGSLAV